MSQLDLARKLYGYNEHNMGDILRKQSNQIMNDTWWNDIQSRKCYIYDYFHDSQPTLNKHLNPQNDPLKTPIDAKYIVTQYGTVSKDQVEYHLQFRPDTPIPIDYYKFYEDKYGATYPIGLYIDIPNYEGDYERWLIVSYSQELSFIKYSILPCNYRFCWCKDYKVYKMWGVARLRNSYNSGLWTDYVITSPENQDQMWIPMNEISEQLYYDDRFIISVDIPKPLAWKVSKVENIHPMGLNKITLSQDKFDSSTDFKVDGDWVANYKEQSVIPEQVIMPDPIRYTYEIKYNGTQRTFKVNGGSRFLSVVRYDDDLTTTIMECVLRFTIDHVDVSDLFEVITNDDFTISVRYIGDDSRLGDIVTITASIDNTDIATIDFIIEGL